MATGVGRDAALLAFVLAGGPGCGGRSSLDAIAGGMSGVPGAREDGTIALADGGVDAATPTEDGGTEAAADASTPAATPESGGPPDHALGDGGNCGCVPGARQPEIVTTFSGFPLSIAIDATSVYWLGGAIGRAPLTGGPSTVLSTRNADGSFGRIVVALGRLYWVNAGIGTTVNDLLLDGGAAVQLGSSTGNGGGIAVDPARVYWSDDQGKVYSVGVGGGTRSVVASTNYMPGNLADEGTVPESVAVDATTLYFSDIDGDLMAVPLGGGTVTTLFSGQPLPPNTGAAFWTTGIALDEANVYWTYCPPASTTSGAVRRIAKTGGPATTLAPGQDCPSDLAVDAANVYWVDYRDATVKRAPLAGGAATVLATCHPYGMAGPVIDATSVYWATVCPDNVSAVLKVDK